MTLGLLPLSHCHIISSIEQKEESRGNEDHVNIIRDYRSKIETELSSICDGILRFFGYPTHSFASSVIQVGRSRSALVVKHRQIFPRKDDKGFLESEYRSFMRHGISIWIDVPIVVLAKDVKESGNQPPSDDVILNSDPSKNYNVVNYDEKVVDGFYDVYGIASNSTKQGKMPLLVDLHATSISDSYDYEVILVNRLIDPALQELQRTVVSLSAECRVLELGPIVSGLVQNIANLVVNTMGGPVIGDAEEILRRWTIRSYELRSFLNTIVLPLGCLDIGLSRHRALLFKACEGKLLHRVIDEEL
ncbi:hypothetical protein IFM89_037507 [Coptis chinensis]|uniref:EDR1/CTR1/ARMC3-like peptidase-like domain-containing protein n=1 Tax=Coptis chinensis TaxID=261450 RepID=A0A835IQ69_9MAGN|nr:hypothetical protein IFM89_037507 [Coptis chinensis]